MINKNEFKMYEETIWKQLGWYPSANQIKQLKELQHLLKEWNKKLNLTRLVKENDFWISQVFDSLWPIKYELQDQKSNLKIIDVGTGCGFPGLAIAIALPKTSVTLVDSINKKTTALKEILEEMGLFSRINILTERIEVTGQNKSFRGKYDIAIARAVAKGPVLAEYLIPLLHPQGQAILYKGKWLQNEHRDLIRSLALLHAKVKRIDTYDLPDQRGSRTAIRLSPQGKCPDKYPRSTGKAIRSPLGNQTEDNR